MSDDSNLTVRVRRKQIIGFLTCQICKDLFQDPMNIIECLHIFCKKCIINKITEEDLSNCPVCNIDLGCAPLDKLRPDHNWNSIRSALLPSLKIKDDDYVFVGKEGMEVDQVVNVEPVQPVVLANVAAAQPEVPSTTPVLANVAVAQSEVPSSTTVLAAQSAVPSTPVLDRVVEAEQSEAPSAPMRVRTKGRSPSSSMLSALLASGDDDTMRVTRSKSNARKLLFANDQSSMSPQKLLKSMEDRPEGLSFSKSPIEVAKSNEKVSRSKSPMKVFSRNERSSSKAPIKVTERSENANRSESPLIKFARRNDKANASPNKVAEKNEKVSSSESQIKSAQRKENATRSESKIKVAASKEKVNPLKSPIKEAEKNEKVIPSESLIKIVESNEEVSPYPTKISKGKEKANTSKYSTLKIVERNEEVILSKTPIKIAESNEKKSSRKKQGTKDKESTQSMPLEDMSDMLTPLIYLLQAAANKKKSAKASGLVSKRKAKNSGNTSKNSDKADDAIVGCIPPPPAAVTPKEKQKRRGRPRKVSPPKEPTIPPQFIIDSAGDQLLKRDYPIWFTLLASTNQEGDASLPQLPPCFLSVKNVKLPVVYIKKYIVQKLNLENEDEVEICMWGEPLPPSLHLKSLMELWHTTPPSERLTARVGESAEDFVMVITYARKAPPIPSNSIPT